MKKQLFSFLLLFFAAALGANAQNKDLFSIVQKGTWYTDLEDVDFLLYYESGKRHFRVTQIGRPEEGQLYAIGGALKSIKGKTNTYNIAAQDDFNGFPFVFRGTLTFTQLSGGKIKVNIKCPDPDGGYPLPHQIILHKPTAKEKAAREKKDEEYRRAVEANNLLSSLNGDWKGMKNADASMKLDLLFPTNDQKQDLGFITCGGDRHEIKDVISVDGDENTAVVKTICSRNGKESKVKLLFEFKESAVDPDVVITVLGGASGCSLKTGTVFMRKE